MTEVVAWTLQISDMSWRNRSFLVDNFPIFEALKVSDIPVAIAGTDFFRQRDFIVDFARKRLLVRSRVSE